MVLLAQDKPKERKGELYFAWGYNTEWYTQSTVHVSQGNVGNVYDLINVKGHDHKGWDMGLLSEPITIPQYNYRLGYFFNKGNSWGIEINFDHTKFIITDGNYQMKGQFGGKSVDSNLAFLRANGFYYYLNNGANFLLFNAVRRWQLCSNADENFKFSGIVKAGIGPVIPHVENSLFGERNHPHFQLGGWNMGIEGALRANFYKYIYLEYANKLDFASYSGLKILHGGTISQSFGTYEMILTLGASIPVGKRI